MANIMQPMAVSIEWRRLTAPPWGKFDIAAICGRIVRLVVGFWLLALAPETKAQLLDDIEVVERDDGVAVLIRFAAQVSYRRHVVAPAGDTV